MLLKMKDLMIIKEILKEKYGAIAQQSKQINKSSCCGSGCGCSNVEFTVMAEDYTKLPGYVPDADLALGCGLPTEFAKIKPGDTVVDLGSGAGNDCFIARAIVGEEGKVIGIDMTEEMISKARENASKLGYRNVDFILGEIENLPIANNIADVVVSNCVLNLVPDKRKAFTEIFRMLKEGGHFCISDIVLQENLPEQLRKDTCLYAGCIAGAMQKDEYLKIIQEAGFVNIIIQKERKIQIPDDVITQSSDLQEEFNKSKIGIFSITVYAEKPCELKYREVETS